MFKTVAKFEKQIGDKTYQFLLDADSKIENAKEALLIFLGHITQIEEQAKAQTQTQAPVAPHEQQASSAPQEPTPQG